MAVIVGQGISVSPVADAELSHESTSTVQNKVVTDAIASEYSTSKTYSVGDVCTHDGKLYECIVDIPTAEGWTLSHWKVSNIGDNVSNLNRQLNDKQDAPETAGTAGQVLSLDNQLNPVWSTPSSGGGDVTDVQINGTSILSDGVANIPLVTSYEQAGAFKTTYNSNTPFKINSNGIVDIKNPTDAEMKAGSSDTRIARVDKQHLAAFYGLAKAAGDTTQAASANAVGTYTEDAKSAIHTMLNGAVAVSGTTPTIAAKDGITYVCGEVATLDITLPASGIFEVQFVSGSAPTVLTATGVSWVNGFDPTALEANKTYDISISNGIGVAVWI